MAIHTITLNTGIELEVNPLMIAAIHPNEQKPETGSIVYILGQRFKIRGRHDVVREALGWRSTARLGFDEGDPNAVQPANAVSRTPPPPPPAASEGNGKSDAPAGKGGSPQK